MGHAHPRVFWEKRLQSIENKRQEREKERQESSRGGNGLEAKEIQEWKEFGGVVWLGRATVERMPGDYSRAMLRKVIEVVKTLNGF